MNPTPDELEQAAAPVAESGQAAAPAADAPAAGSAVDAPAPRRRRSRAAAAADAPEAAVVEASEPVAAQADAGQPPTDEAVAPKRRRTRARRPDPAGEQPDVASVQAAPDGGGAPEGGVAAAAEDAQTLPPTAAVDGAGGEAVAAEPALPVVDVAQRFEDVVSGEYDQEGEVSEAEAAEVGKRVLRPEPEAPKLHKVLAQAGIGSRRDMEALIEEGRVTVNGETAHLGMRIVQGDQIAVAGKPVKVRIAPPTARVLAYHKPAGEVVTHNDPDGRPTVFRRLPRLNRGKWLSVGRLDLNTEGLLLFTNSGDLANQLMHPRFGVEREYAVRVLGDLSEEARAQLLEGVEIEGQKAAFKSVEDGGGVGANHWWRVVITEGRNREVRKLFDAVGLTVSRLIRIRYGTVVLPRGLKRGVWVELGDNDVRTIRRLASGERRPNQGPGQGGGQGNGQQAAGEGGAGQPPRDDGDRRGRRNKRRGGRNGGQGDQPRGPQQQQAGGQRGPQHGGQPRPPRERERSYDDDREPDDPMHIPNPLEQTFDRRFASGSKRIAAGFGRPSDESHRQPANRKGGPREPDPMQTSVGYIGADAYFQKPGGGGKRGRRR